ncbi:hypothetical protein GGH99_002458 [Coemansia sp. RSA 1285]|nr:hypothetical protein GGH99_002458 [Coemansia sp. RSA 1285]
MENQALLNQATDLYNQAVNEIPPNRTKLDNLADFLNNNPRLLYHGFFEKGYEAVNAVVNVFASSAGTQEDEESLSILTPPAIWGWSTLELAVCSVPPRDLFETEYPDYVARFSELAKRTLIEMETTPMLVVRRAIQALTRFWPVLMGFCVDAQNDMERWRPVFHTMVQLADLLSQLSESSDDPALQMHLVKFLETEAVMFSNYPPSGSNPTALISLNSVPETHAFVSKHDLAKRGDTARLQLLRLLPNSDSIGLCNTSFITALVNSIVYLMSLRPQFCQELADKLTDWYAVINSSEQMMTHSQLVIIGKTLRISLLQLYTRSYMGGYSDVLENTLDRIGGPEWSSWQERQTKEKARRERQRAREQSHAAKRVQESSRSTSRWVPSHADDQEMAEQPAPGDKGGAAMEASLQQRGERAGAHGTGRSRVASHAHKRPGEVVVIEDDDDEEKQLQMMEENVKRIRLEEAKAQQDSAKEMDVDAAAGTTADSPASAAIVAAAIQAPMDVDIEMEKEVRAAVESGTFDIEELGNLTSDERQAQLVETMGRIVAGSHAIRKFIEESRLRAYGFVPGLQSSLARGAVNGLPLLHEPMPKAVLKNGLSTNYGILEDVTLMLVRSITDFYLAANDIVDTTGKPADAMAEARMANMHASIEVVLESIIEAPNELYNLAIALLYEIWMAVLVTDPDMKQTPDKSGCRYSALSLYLGWCERILESIVKYSMETTASQQTAQVVPEAPASGTEQAAGGAVPTDQENQAQQQQQQQQQIKLDHLILSFMLEVPYMPPKAIGMVELCLKTPGAAALGFVTLEKAMELRAPIMKPCLDILLTYSVHPERTTRVGCIRAVKRFYTTSEHSQLIEKFALASMKRGMQTASVVGRKMEETMKAIIDRPSEPPIGSENGSGGAENKDNNSDTNANNSNKDENSVEKKKAEIMEVRKRGEKDIDETLLSHMELPLALCTRNLNLLLDLFADYAQATLPVQIHVRKIITPLIRSVVSTPGKLVPVLQQFPAGAETAVVRIIAILCVDGPQVPSKELVNGVLEMCEERKLGAEFVVFLAGGMEKPVLLQWLSPIVRLLEKKEGGNVGLVSESFRRITTSFPGRPSVLSPTELLIALHNNVEMDLVDKGVASTAVNIFEGMRKPDGNPVFETSVIEAGLKLLQEQPKMPPLVMYTAEVYHRKRGGSAGMVIGLLGKLIERKVWEMDDHVKKAFIWCFATMQPGSLGLIKNIPSDGLKKLMENAPPSLWSIVRDYVAKMPESYRKSLDWLFAQETA